jgi:hypothetical protein
MCYPYGGESKTVAGGGAGVTRTDKTYSGQGA